MTRTPYELAAEAAMVDRLASDLRREAERAELRAAMAKATVRLYALADALEADAEALAEGSEFVL